VPAARQQVTAVASGHCGVSGQRLVTQSMKQLACGFVGTTMVPPPVTSDNCSERSVSQFRCNRFAILIFFMVSFPSV
jgi:hypothetical protein